MRKRRPMLSKGSKKWRRGWGEWEVDIIDVGSNLERMNLILF